MSDLNLDMLAARDMVAAGCAERSKHEWDAAPVGGLSGLMLRAGTLFSANVRPDL